MENELQPAGAICLELKIVLFSWSARHYDFSISELDEYFR